MLLIKSIRSTIVDKFKSFCKYSSLHGFYYFYKQTGSCGHVLWCLIIVSCAALCCFLSHMIWEKFVMDPTLTVVETTHYSVANIPFPAVSICDTEKVYTPKTDEITDILILRGFNGTEIQKFYRSFTNVEDKGYTPEPVVRKMHSVLDDMGYHWKLLLDMFKRPCDDLIVECSWRSRPHNCSKMFRSVFTIAGYCCQFDINYLRRRTDVNTNYISGVESTEALNIVVNGDTNTAEGSNMNKYPALYVFDSKDEVTLVDGYITLTPEVFFDVNVYVWTTDSSNYVKALSLRNRKCILDTDQGLGANFYEGCMSRLILQRVVAKCKCLPFDYTAQELNVTDYAVCTWDRLICIYKAIDLIKVDIKDIITQNECYQRCDYTQYDNEVELVKNQRHLRNHSHTRVAVHFAQSTCIKYRREVLYTWDQMLANLGGIFGLCLGGSMISIIEIIWFLCELLFDVICIVCKKHVQPTRKNAVKKNKVFVISQKSLNSKNLSEKVGPYKFVN